MKRLEDLTETEVRDTLRRILVLDDAGPLAYMTNELEQMIVRAAVEATSLQITKMIEKGAMPAAAALVGNNILPAIAFNLGLAVGRELTAGESFASFMEGQMGDG